DGRLSPITSGLHRLLLVAPSDTRVTPVALIYDFMTTHRLRLFVDLAPPIEQATMFTSHELNAQLRVHWLRNMRFSATQLASGLLMRLRDQPGTQTITRAELTTGVGRWAARLAAAGRHVDERLLRPASLRRVVGGYLRYAERHSILRRVGRDRWTLADTLPELAVPLGDVGYDQAPLAYALNELHELLSVGATVATEVEPAAQLGGCG
ncbi:MAG TPA: hypothetical protein VKQ36_17240, partial [Ktedonobacterales bacterium]|nr:hypothetical protein [Ktedonobacterales bacterium]